MATNQERVKAILESFDKTTNEIAEEVKALQEKVKAGSLTGAEEEEFLSSLESIAGRLKQVGKSEPVIEEKEPGGTTEGGTTEGGTTEGGTEGGTAEDTGNTTVVTGSSADEV